MIIKMSDSNSHLQEEIEVLEAIYIHELEISKNESDDVESITLQLHPATGEDLDKRYVCMTLVLRPPPQYPAQPPDIVIKNPRGIAEEELQSLLEDMRVLADERRGESMLFELIELAKEALTEGNIPHCQCMVCLEHFHEGDSFTRTDCYHYFHHSCLVRYVHHVLDQEPEHAKISLHVKEKDKEKLFCPVCRKAITYNVSDVAILPEEEKIVFKPTQEMIDLQNKMAAVLETQRQMGGIIDVEAERNRYLVTHQDVVFLPSTAGSEEMSADSRVPVDNVNKGEASERGGKSFGRDGNRAERHQRSHNPHHHHHHHYNQSGRRGDNSGYVRGRGRGNHYFDRKHDRRDDHWERGKNKARTDTRDGNEGKDFPVKDGIDKRSPRYNDREESRRPSQAYAATRPRSGFREEKSNLTSSDVKLTSKPTEKQQITGVGAKDNVCEGDERRSVEVCDSSKPTAIKDNRSASQGQCDRGQGCDIGDQGQGQRSDCSSSAKSSPAISSLPKLTSSDLAHEKNKICDENRSRGTYERNNSSRGRNWRNGPRSPRKDYHKEVSNIKFNGTVSYNRTDSEKGDYLRTHKSGHSERPSSTSFKREGHSERGGYRGEGHPRNQDQLRYRDGETRRKMDSPRKTEFQTDSTGPLQSEGKSGKLDSEHNHAKEAPVPTDSKNDDSSRRYNRGRGRGRRKYDTDSAKMSKEGLGNDNHHDSSMSSNLGSKLQLLEISELTQANKSKQQTKEEKPNAISVSASAAQKDTAKGETQKVKMCPPGFAVSRRPPGIPQPANLKVGNPPPGF